MATSNCSFCGAKITTNQEQTSFRLFQKPVCSRIECEKKAQVETNKETEKLMTPRAKVLALLARRGFEEQSVKGILILDTNSTKVAVDLNKTSVTFPELPQIGILQINGDILEEGHGINRIDDIRREIGDILKSKAAPKIGENHEEEHKETEAGKDEKVKECETKNPETRMMQMKGGADSGKKETPTPMKKKIIETKTELIPKPLDTTLTVEVIQQYICPDATDAEAYSFLQLCKYRDLNPFLKEAYLVKYKNAPATMIVGKDAFTRKAEESGKLDGFCAGILVCTPLDKKIEERVGTVCVDGEKLIGGWARVTRKDMTQPFEIRVSLNEYIKIVDGKPQRNWATMPATMIRKVALVQALREAFTKELGGCYDAVEIVPEEVR